MNADNQNAKMNRRALLGGLIAAPAAAIALPNLALASNTEATAPTQHHMAEFSRRKIGDIEIIGLADGYSTLPLSLMPNFEAGRADELSDASYKSPNNEFLNIAINGYIIKTENHTIAVDVGAPSFLSPNVGAWHQSLELAGVKPEDIDILFLTHAHADHVAGMTGENGERLLPNAQLILSDAEWQFAHDEAMVNQMPEAFKPMAYYAQGQLAPFANDREMISMAKETEIAPGVTAVPMPGHTAGHMGLRITSGSDSLMIWGDLIHAPAFQFAEPGWGIVFDADMAKAHESRAKYLDQMAVERTMVAGMHLDFPSFGYVENAQQKYRYIAAPRDYGV